jgi:hypothetical protein
MKKNSCGIDFNDILKENLKDPKFRKLYKRAQKRTELAEHFNNTLLLMGIKDMFVEVLDIDAYDWKK